SNVATVSITVAAVNDAPVAVNDTATTAEDTPVSIAVLGNDSDVDGDTLTVSVATAAAHGSAVANADGTITYTPAGKYNGIVSFPTRRSSELFERRDGDDHRGGSQRCAGRGQRHGDDGGRHGGLDRGPGE